MEVTKQIIIDINTAIISYKDETSIGIGGVSALLPIKLLGADQHQRYTGYLAGSEDLAGEVNTIQLLGIAASCGSADFNIHILNMNDLTKLDTINEALSYEEVDKSFSDYTFNNMFIQNEDITEVAYLYVYIENNGAVVTGDIEITLTYKPIYN
jgi:hypothetical protein